MSRSALYISSMLYRRSQANLLHRPFLRTFSADKEHIKESTQFDTGQNIPPHLIRKGKKRQIPEPYMKILKQVPPRHKDRFGQGIIAFIFIFTFGVNGIYFWQAYTLRDRLKAQGVIEGGDDERWTNVSTYRKN